LIKHDGLVEEARSELKQTESRKMQDIEDKDMEIQEQEIKLSVLKNELMRQLETNQLHFEEERSKCHHLSLRIEDQIRKQREQTSTRYQS
jgi:hypothetical protein